MSRAAFAHETRASFEVRRGDFSHASARVQLPRMNSIHDFDCGSALFAKVAPNQPVERARCARRSPAERYPRPSSPAQSCEFLVDEQ